MNVMTNAMERLTKILLKTDSIIMKLGTEPYGTRKATAAEQKTMYKNLTPEKLYGLIQTHGEAKVNSWLDKQMLREEQNG